MSVVVVVVVVGVHLVVDENSSDGSIDSTRR